MIIGLTGTKASGKGMVSEILREKGFFYTSTSDQVRKEAILKNLINYTTADLQNIGNEIREKFGAEELIKRCIKEADGKEKVVIDGIRNPGEVKELKKLGGILIAIDAPVELRFERIIARKRESDPKTLEDFKKMEERDRGNKESEIGQQVDKCMEMADHAVMHDNTLETLKTKIEYILLKETSSKKRPDWDEYFMEICRAVATRATCDRGKSGCVIAKNKQILVTGYVGAPKGLPHCDEVGHQMKTTIHEDGTQTNHCVRTTHAEQNAICQAAKLGVPIEGATLYCKMTPCSACAKMIINSGINRIVCEKKYHTGKESEEMFSSAGVQISFFNNEIESYSNQK